MTARSDIYLSFDRHLGSKIRTCRKSMGLSQEKVVQELAFLGLDMQRDALAKMELGIRAVCAMELLLLSQVINLSVEDLVSFLSQK